MVAIHRKPRLPDAWTELWQHVDAPPDCLCGKCVRRRMNFCNARFAYIAAARQSGKSEGVKRKIVRLLPVKKPWRNPRYFYAAPTFQQVRNIAWDDFKRLVPPDWITKISESNLQIHTRFGSMLQLIGLDKPQRFEGIPGGWDGGAVDEACDIKPGTRDLTILPQLGWRNGWLWMLGVPKRTGVGAAEFRKRFAAVLKGEDPTGVTFAWSSEGIIPDEQLQLFRADMAQKDFDEQFGGVWQDAGGGIFYAFDAEFNVRPCNHNPDMPIIVGSDFNVDPMAWVLCHIINGQLQVFDEIWMRNTNTPRTLESLWQKYKDHRGGWQFYGDATGRARKSAASMSDYLLIANDPNFKQAGRTLHYLHSNPDIHDRFAAANALLCNTLKERRLFVDPRCKHLIEDLGARAYAPGTNDLPPKEGDVGHITDALTYIIYRLFPIRIMGAEVPEVHTSIPT